LIDFGISSSYLSARTTAARPTTARSTASSPDNRLRNLLGSRSKYRYADRKVGRLQDALNELRSLWGRRRSGSVGRSPQPVRVSSSAPLDFGAETRATLSSPLEINTVTTSFSTTAPEWDGWSTADMTIGGEYDGSNGTQTLTLEVARGGLVGGRNTRIVMRGEDGRRIDNVVIRRSDDPGTVYEFDNGLTLSVTEGVLSLNDSAALDVAVHADTPLDAGQSFDTVTMIDPGTGSAVEIADGSFTVNGVVVDVFADDSLTAVLERINASAAGVNASFDAASGAVLMESDATGSEAGIVLDDDTSGFLAAAGLDDAAVTPGDDDGRSAAMNDVFSGLSAGTLSINGAAVAFDPAHDSLGDLINRLNASPAGVSARIVGDRISITGLDPTVALDLDDGGTGVFDALSIAGGTYEPTATEASVRRGFSRHQALRIAGAMAEISETMNELLASPADPSQNSSLLGGLRDSIRERVSDAYGTDGTRFRSRFGVDFDFRDGRRRVFDFHDSDRSTFAATVQTDAKSVENLLFGNGGSDEGLVGGIEDVLNDTMSTIDEQLGSVGRALDTRA